MRRRNHYGYGAYRGRSKFRTFLKFVIAVLAVVLALLVGAFFFLQRYMVVSSTGGIYFDLPFLDREVEPAPSGGGARGGFLSVWALLQGQGADRLADAQAHDVTGIQGLLVSALVAVLPEAPVT